MQYRSEPVVLSLATDAQPECSPSLSAPAQSGSETPEITLSRQTASAPGPCPSITLSARQTASCFQLPSCQFTRLEPSTSEFRFKSRRIRIITILHRSLGRSVSIYNLPRNPLGVVKSQRDQASSRRTADSGLFHGPDSRTQRSTRDCGQVGKYPSGMQSDGVTLANSRRLRCKH